jgi:DNA-binding MarR family transcriptional regulator
MITDNNFQKFFTALEEFHNRVESQMHSRLRDSFGDLTILQIRSCMVIHRFSKIRMTDFAKIMQLKTSGATQLVDKLIELDLVNREYDPDDRRAVVIVLTPTMNSKMKKMKAIESEVIRESFAKLDQSELSQLTTIFSKLI